MASLDSTVTRALSARCNAVARPAAPLPMTSTSVRCLFGKADEGTLKRAPPCQLVDIEVYSAPSIPTATAPTAVGGTGPPRGVAVGCQGAGDANASGMVGEPSVVCTWTIRAGY